jgi:hypothetical protein
MVARFSTGCSVCQARHPDGKRLAKHCGVHTGTS